MIGQEIIEEMERQEKKWGHVQKDITGWLLVIEAELQEAKHAWIKQTTGKHSLRNELIQVAASVYQAIYKLDGREE